MYYLIKLVRTTHLFYLLQPTVALSRHFGFVVFGVRQINWGSRVTDHLPLP